MIAFLESLAIVFGAIAGSLIIGIPIGYLYLIHVIFPLLNYGTHTDCLCETNASGVSDRECSGA